MVGIRLTTPSRLGSKAEQKQNKTLHGLGLDFCLRYPAAQLYLQK